MKKPTILISDDDEFLRQDLKERLLHQGFKVIEASEKVRVIQILQNGGLDLAIIGSSRNGTWNGVKMAEQIRRQDEKLPIILITKHSSESQVLAALKAGVNDYFKVPFSRDELVVSVKRHLMHASKQATANTASPDPDLNHDQPMLGQSQLMQQLREQLLKVASTDSTVLITGETGTGKELTADLIHQKSPRQKKPFICVNCAALPESLLESELFGYEKGAFTGATTLKQGEFELAEGGTIFLDEIGDMSSHAQSKILRAIERKEVSHLGGKKSINLDVRIVAATNQDLEQLVTEGTFRKDLYYRLNVARIHLPPLRDRKEDIPHLLDYYIQNLNQQFGLNVEGFTEEALTCLLHYEWPGNVRELKNLLEATFINVPSRMIKFMDLPASFQRQLKETETLPQNERDRMLFALFATNWNKSKAAQKLHWSRMTLYRKMAKYHIVTK